MHASQWIKNQSQSNQQLIRAIASDIPQQNWRIKFEKETQPRSASEDLFSVQKQFNSMWYRKLLRQVADVESQLQNLDFVKYIRGMEFELHRHFYEALKTQTELELRREFLFSLNNFIEKQENRIGQGVGKEYDLEIIRQQGVLESQRIRALNAKLSDMASEISALSEFDKKLIPLKGRVLPVWNSQIQDAELRLIKQNLELQKFELESKKLEREKLKLQNRPFKQYDLEIGSKRFSGSDSSGSGVLVGISSELPFSFNNKNKRKRYAKMDQFRKARYNQKRSYLSSRLNSLGQLISQTIKQSEEQRQVLVGPAEDLFKNKQDAYYNGAGSMLDLLEAREHLMDSYLELNETEYSARLNWLKFKALIIGVQ